jgi:hypothetical protein
MENKKKTVEDFIQQGEKLRENPGAPKFLDAHVNKLKEAWTVSNEEAIKRKNALADNLEAWKNFEEKRTECAKMLDMADAELKSLRKNFNMERAPVELQEKVKVAVTMRQDALSHHVLTDHFLADLTSTNCSSRQMLLLRRSPYVPQKTSQTNSRSTW